MLFRFFSFSMLAFLVAMPSMAETIFNERTFLFSVGGGLGVQSSYKPEVCDNTPGCFSPLQFPTSLQYNVLATASYRWFEDGYIYAGYQWLTADGRVHGDYYKFRKHNFILGLDYFVLRNLSFGAFAGIAPNVMDFSGVETGPFAPGDVVILRPEAGPNIGGRLIYYPMVHLAVELQFTYFLGFPVSYTIPGTYDWGMYNISGMSHTSFNVRYFF